MCLFGWEILVSLLLALYELGRNWDVNVSKVERLKDIERPVYYSTPTGLEIFSSFRGDMTYGSQISGYCVVVVESVIGFLYAVACGAWSSYLCTDDIPQEFSKGLVFSPHTQPGWNFRFESVRNVNALSIPSVSHLLPRPSHTHTHRGLVVDSHPSFGYFFSKDGTEEEIVQATWYLTWKLSKRGEKLVISIGTYSQCIDRIWSIRLISIVIHRS
jgi:hypothetical protein